MTNNSTIRFDAVLQLVKAGEGQSKVMKMRGIASTPSLDADGEYLDPNGFDVSYFLKYGYMNWNHQTNKDPLALVGRPTSAKVNSKGQLEIEFYLFPDSVKAQQIYELQKLLEAQGMALGLSIEGEVLERDKKNPAKVLRARITGCAITPNPKNNDTVMSIIKAQNFNKLSAYENEDEETREKALTAQSPSGRALAKEDLVEGVKKTFTKGAFFEKIFRDLPHISIVGAEKLYELTLKIEKSLNMAKDTKTVQEVSEEAIEKALQALELDTEPVTTDEPTTSTEPVTTDPVTTDEPTDNTTVQAVIEQKLEKALVEIELLKSQIPTNPETTEAVDSEKLLKGIGVLLKEHNEHLHDELDEKFEAVGTIQKSLMDQITELNERLENLESQPTQRKSVTTKSFVEKSFDDDLNKKPERNVLSISRNKREILDTLTKAITTDNGITDKLVASEIMMFEQAGAVGKNLIAKAKELGITLVR